MLQVDGGPVIIILTAVFLWSDESAAEGEEKKIFLQSKAVEKGGKEVGPRCKFGENGSRLAVQVVLLTLDKIHYKDTRRCCQKPGPSALYILRGQHSALWRAG